MGNVCCVTEEAFNDAKVKEVIDGEERGKLLGKNGHNNDTIPSVSSQNYVSSTNQASSDHDPDTLLEAFEESCVNKDFDNAMYVEICIQYINIILYDIMWFNLGH